jgi:hypothetical protein
MDKINEYFLLLGIFSSKVRKFRNFLLHVSFTHGTSGKTHVRVFISQIDFPAPSYVILKIPHMFMFSPFTNFVNVFCSLL